MTLIKNISCLAVMLFMSTALTALEIEEIKSQSEAKPRPGDGKEKYNPRDKQGESLKGYFYRIYGDTAIVAAKDVQFKGPFKRKKMKKFLKECRKMEGEISTEKVEQTHGKKVIVAYTSGVIPRRAILHHITLKSTTHCLLNGVSVSERQWSAVYLDSDATGNLALNFYVDYDKCNSDDRAYLSIGEYSIHYDDNPKCHADLSDISDD